MGLTLQTAPAAETVSRAEVKAHARITIDDDDDLIDVYLPAARRYVERLLRQSFVNTTWLYTADAFPRGRGEILLDRAPLSSISSVKYYDEDGTLQTWAASNYQADTNSMPGRIAPAYGVTWPTTRGETLNAVQITFVAGHGAAASDVPAEIKVLIKQLVALMYREREVDAEAVAGRSSLWQNLYRSLRLNRIG